MHVSYDIVERNCAKSSMIIVLRGVGTKSSQLKMEFTNWESVSPCLYSRFL